MSPSESVGASTSLNLKGNHAPKINGAGFKDVTIDTHGADGRFGALFFIEKEGFRDLFKSVNLAERYDIAIMSSKGVSVTAARKLADLLCHEHAAASVVPLTLHGGSGTDDGDFQRAISAGITTVHINTELRLAWRQGLEAALAENSDEVVPYKIYGKSLSAMAAVADERLRLFNAG
jgi:hypothetical protein